MFTTPDGKRWCDCGDALTGAPQRRFCDTCRMMRDQEQRREAQARYRVSEQGQGHGASLLDIRPGT